MKLTRRDRIIVRDVALSIVLSRDHFIRLGYFSSVTRANTRLRELTKLGLVQRLETPFFAQSLYGAGPKATDVLEGHVGRLTQARTASPRFIQHALNVADVRIALTNRSHAEWRHEQFLWRTLPGLERQEVRPDGLLLAKVPIFVEVDLGNVSLAKFRAKLLSYRALALSGSCEQLYGFADFRLLVVTTGSLRSRHLSRQLPNPPGFELLVQTFGDLGLAPTPNWS